MNKARLSRLVYYDYQPGVLIALREARGLKQTEVAAQMGVVVETVRRIEAGTAASFDLVSRYCELLGLDPVTVINQTPRHEPERRGRRGKPALSVPAPTP